MKKAISCDENWQEVFVRQMKDVFLNMHREVFNSVCVARLDNLLILEQPDGRGGVISFFFLLARKTDASMFSKLVEDDFLMILLHPEQDCTKLQPIELSIWNSERVETVSFLFGYVVHLECVFDFIQSEIGSKPFTRSMGNLLAVNLCAHEIRHQLQQVHGLFDQGRPRRQFGDMRVSSRQLARIIQAHRDYVGNLVNSYRRSGDRSLFRDERDAYITANRALEVWLDSRDYPQRERFALVADTVCSFD